MTSVADGDHLQRVLQRRTVAILSISTILGGLGIGAAFSVGSLLIVEVTGSTVLSGLSATMVAVGAAIAGIPLAKLAAKRGRRVALSSGNVIAAAGALSLILSTVVGSGPVLIASFAVLGTASAVQLQARFSAADLALPENRARDLSLVVWSITLGAVVGPNLIGPGQIVGDVFGLTPLAGVFVFTFFAQAISAMAVWVFLRPDPLVAAREFGSRVSAAAVAAATRGAVSGSAVNDSAANSSRLAQWLVIVLIASGHAVMVAIMAMTPVHLVEHGGSVEVVGLTISLHVAGMYALSPVVGVLTGRFGALPVIFTGFFILALAALGAGLGGASVLAVQGALILLGLGWCAVTVAGAALLTDLTPAELRPVRQGQADTSMNAAGALFGGFSGLIFAAGGFPLLATISGLAILLGVGATSMLVRQKQRVAAQPAAIRT